MTTTTTIHPEAQRVLNQIRHELSRVVEELLGKQTAWLDPRAQRLVEERVLLQGLARVVEDFLEHRPGGTAKGLETTLEVYHAWMRQRAYEEGRDAPVPS